MSKFTPGQQPQQDYYQKFKQTKDLMIDHALTKVAAIKNNAKQTGEILDRHNEQLDHVNNRLSGIERRAEKTQNSMERYLEQSNDCKLYIILAIQVFLFIVLMSI